MRNSIEDKRDEWDGPVPVPSGVTEAFWEATLDGQLLVQQCVECGTTQFYPRIVCTSCGALDPEWIEASGVGEVYSYVVCHLPGEPGFADYVPYVVAIVELAEGPRTIAFVPSDAADIEIGTTVEVEFWQVSDDAAIPVFVAQ